MSAEHLQHILLRTMLFYYSDMTEMCNMQLELHLFNNILQNKKTVL